MKDIVWDKVLSVDFAEIDEDHRKLVNIFNELNRAMSGDESPEYLAAVLEELVNCTVWHFSHEERLMLKYDYKALDDHRAAHGELIASVKDLQDRINRADNVVSEDDIVYLERWLTEHILTEDMRLGSYLSQVT